MSTLNSGDSSLNAEKVVGHEKISSVAFHLLPDRQSSRMRNNDHRG